MKEPARAVRFDRLLLLVVMALVSLGLVMVYSASAIAAQQKLGDSFFYLKRQAVAAGIGLLAMAVALKLGYRKLARLAYPLLVCAVISLVLVLVPGVGTTVGGARRWIRVLGFSIQPAEIAKLAWVIYLAYSLAKKREKVTLFSIGFLPHLLMAGLLVALCMAEPDFGSSVGIVFLLFVLLFAAGTKLSYLVGSVLLAIPVAYQAIASSPYRLNRILAFLDPWGVTAVMGLYAVIVWRGLRASLKAGETFGSYLGFGITALFGFQAVVNIFVAMGLAPTKGLTLPLISYGGTSLSAMMGAAGILLSISATSAHPANLRSWEAPRQPRMREVRA